MKESPHREIICRWMHRAIDDLEIAEEIIQGHPGGSTFHSQQAAEKALKALLILLGTRSPKTHRIELLLQLIDRAGIDTGDVRRHRPERLSNYAVEVRYPDFGEEPSLDEAIEALKTAKSVVEWVGDQLRRLGVECRHTTEI